jgi:hypothetical protein
MTETHSYLAPLQQKYQKCILCDKRKTLVCVKCGYCYTCHSISERAIAKRPGAYAAVARLLDIESPHYSEIERA